MKKFLKLFLEIEFYRIAIYLIFLLTGYSSISIKELLKTFLPVYSIGTGFTNSYLVFFLFIPYLNLLVKTMKENEHRALVIIILIIGTIMPTFLKAPSAFTYVGWFMAVYFMGAYIRMYPRELFNNNKILGYALGVSLSLSWLSVIFGAYIYKRTGISCYYYFVADSNKLMAIVTAISAFLFFKNLHLKYHPVINKIAASAFGVLLIHANSDLMRQWLWKDLLRNTDAFHEGYFIFHAVVSVVLIYVVCTLIDMARIKLLEKPFFEWYDKKFNNYITKQ